MSTIIIYALTEPDNIDIIKYIGKTRGQIDRRLSDHMHCCTRTNTPKNQWLRKIKNRKTKPQVIILDTVLESEWQFWEQYYISLYRSWGFDLKNLTNGGECGNTSPRSATLRKHLSNKMKGKRNSIMTEDGRRSLSQKMKMRMKNPKANPFYGVSLRGSLSPNAQKIDMLDLNGNFIRTFGSIVDGSRFIVKGDILTCLRQPITPKGKNRTAGGYRWRKSNVIFDLDN